MNTISKKSIAAVKLLSKKLHSALTFIKKDLLIKDLESLAF